jgi:hypothetical protein
MEILKQLLGNDSYVNDIKVLEAFAKDNSFVNGFTPRCLVKPRTIDDIDDIVKTAGEKGIGLVPCSSKGPRHRGDTVPTAEGVAIVDLSNLKSIRRMDKRNKVAIIEPGVTFEELQAAAEKAGLRILMPLLPRKTKSALGSYLEREPITTPKYHWDMTDPMMSSEIIFGTGDMFRTGGAAGPGTLEEQWSAGAAQKNPMGPGQTDFLRVVQGAQGTMGIVTWASVKLELMPSLQKSFFVTANSPKEFDDLIDYAYAIMKPKLPDECLIFNAADFALISGLKSAKDLPAWILLYTISGYEYFPDERIDYIEKDIADMTAHLSVKSAWDLEGIPADNIIKMIRKPCDEPYWKNRWKDACTDIFCITTLDRTKGLIEIMEEEIRKHGFSRDYLGIYIQPIQHGRNCHLEFNLMYDPRSMEEEKMVKSLFENAGLALINNGAFFSRPYGIWSDLVYKRDKATVKALHLVKEILDPKWIFNPGKLCFKKEEV